MKEVRSHGYTEVILRTTFSVGHKPVYLKLFAFKRSLHDEDAFDF